MSSKHLKAQTTKIQSQMVKDVEKRAKGSDKRFLSYKNKIVKASTEVETALQAVREVEGMAMELYQME